MKRALERIIRVIAGLTFLASISVATPPIASAADPLTMKISTGLDGWVRAGGWLPIDVELTNDGADLDARLVVDVGTGMGIYGKGAAPFRTEYTAVANLPRHSHKLIRLSIPYDNHAPDLSVKLMRGADTLLEQKVTPQLLETNQLLVGVLSEHPPQSIQSFGSLTNADQRTVRPVWLNGDSFPERPEQFGSLDLLIVDSFPTASLTDAQRNALKDWVTEGGTLLAIGGGDWRRTLTPLPTGLLPVAVQSDGAVPASDSLARFAGLQQGPSGQIDLSQSSVHDGQVLAVVGSSPLIVVARRGLGRVAYVAVDPMADPLAEWRDAPMLWHAILAEALPSGDTVLPLRGQPLDPSLQFLSPMVNALSNFPSLEPPSLHTLTFVLAGYILLIGFVSYAVLGMMRRRELGWITIPAVALAFTIGTYAVARYSHGSDVIVSTISIVRLDPAGPAAAVSAVGAFAPGDADERVTIASPSLPLRLPTNYYGPGPAVAGSSQNTALGMTIDEGSQSQSIDLAPAAPWALRGMWMRHTLDDAGQIDADLHAEGQHVRGTIANRTRFNLNDCVVVAGNSFVHLGALPVGASANVDLVLQPNDLANFKGPQGLYQVYSPSPVNPTVGGSASSRSTSLTVQQDRMRKLPIFMTWAQASPSVGGRDSTSLYFVGWSDERLVPIHLRDQAVVGPSLDLITQPLDVNLDGAFDVGPGLIPGHIVDVTGSAPYVNGPSGLRLDHGAVTMEFQAPHPGHLQSLGFHVTTFGNVTTGQGPFAADVFDWSSGTWQKLGASDIRPASVLMSQPSPPSQGAPVAVPTPPPVLAVGGSQISVATVMAMAPGGAYEITLDSLPWTRYVSPSGMVRLRLSTTDAPVPLSTVSLVAKGSP